MLSISSSYSRIALVSHAFGAAPVVTSSASPFQAQFGQDYFLYSRFFSGRTNGIFVELGANDGITFSNTFAFQELLNWTGILIEPSDQSFELLHKNRPNCQCIHACITQTAGYYSFREDGLYSSVGGQLTTETRWCNTLPNIFDSFFGGPGHVDYLSLDIEGGELGVLRSMDFARHTVDVLSIEVKSERQAELINSHLEKNGFQYVERLFHDNIYVLRRGFRPDPTCMFPTLRLEHAPKEQPSMDWSSLRVTVWRFLKSLPEDLHNVHRDQFWLTKGLLEAHQYFLKVWYGPYEDWLLWEHECPAGAFAMVLVHLLVDRGTLDSSSHGMRIATELESHVAFLPHGGRTLISHICAQTLPLHDFKPREAKRFRPRLPLARFWHELSWGDIIESGWPILGLFGALSRFISRTDSLSVKHKEYTDQWTQAPKASCKMLTDWGPSERSLSSSSIEIQNALAKKAPYTGQHLMSEDLAFDAELCGLIGYAAAYAYQASVNVANVGPRECFVAIANWTTACSSVGDHRAGDMQKLCATKGASDCAGIVGGHAEQPQLVPRTCLQLRQATSKWFRLRHQPVLAGTPAAVQVEQADRLIHELVRRNSMFVALSAIGSFEIRSHPSSGLGSVRSNMFDLLQDIQTRAMEALF